MQRLGVSEKDCLVVEDSVIGLQVGTRRTIYIFFYFDLLKKSCWVPKIVKF